MTRKKVPLQFITSDSSRKVTFKKRKKGLIKKVSELSTLCGIEACAIVYGPFSNEPEVWPSPAEARRTIARFRNMSEMDRSKGMVNQQGFLRQRIGKAETQLKKQQRDNHEKEVTQAMYQTLTAPPTALIGLNLPDLNELDSSVGKTLHEVEERIRLLKKKPTQQVPHQQPPQQPPQQQQLGNGDFRPQQGSESRVRVPDGIQMEGQGGGSGGGGFSFETVVMEQPPPPPPQQWYMDLLKPSELFGGAGSGGGLGFANKNNEEANNNAMMMMMPSSSSSMAMQMPNTNNPNGSSSSWPNFLYP